MAADQGKGWPAGGNFCRLGAVPGIGVEANYYLKLKDLKLWAQSGAGFAWRRDDSLAKKIQEERMNTAILVGELALAVGFLGVIVRGLIEQVQELRLLARHAQSLS